MTPDIPNPAPALQEMIEWLQKIEKYQGVDPNTVRHMAKAIRDHLATPPASEDRAAGPGWQLVPKEPTNEMIEALAMQNNLSPEEGEEWVEPYYLMLKAAPKPPAASVPGKTAEEWSLQWSEDLRQARDRKQPVLNFIDFIRAIQKDAIASVKPPGSP